MSATVEDEEMKASNPFTPEELTEKVIGLSERIAKLEALMERYGETLAEIKARVGKIEAKFDEDEDESNEIRAITGRLEIKLDIYFWLWLGTIAAWIILRVMRLI